MPGIIPCSASFSPCGGFAFCFSDIYPSHFLFPPFPGELSTPADCGEEGLSPPSRLGRVRFTSCLHPHLSSSRSLSPGLAAPTLVLKDKSGLLLHLSASTPLYPPHLPPASHLPPPSGSPHPLPALADSAKTPIPKKCEWVNEVTSHSIFGFIL